MFKLQERLERELGVAGFHGQATAKSSIGRVDVLARLIVDGMDTYESFDPAGLIKGSGEMYLEITPMTFGVRVREGRSLSQLTVLLWSSGGRANQGGGTAGDRISRLGEPRRRIAS